VSREERLGFRDQAYSRWHRSLPDQCAFLDVDWAEICHKCYTPLALFELARDTGQKFKVATTTAKLGEMAGLPAYTVLYRVDNFGEIDQIRIRRMIPDPYPSDGSFDCISPDRLAGLITKIHNRKCTGCSR
jgi:hypothetical protein